MYTSALLKKLVTILSIGIIFSLTSASFLSAASLSIISDKSIVNLNDVFVTTVYVNSQGVAINNAEGDLTFPADLLQVQSISTADSVFTIWVEQPSFSNTAGTVSFNGGVPNPGFNGTTGKLFRVIFKAIKAGTVPISFTSANILANDGSGTDVTSKLNNTVVTVKSSVVEENPKPVQTSIADNVGDIPTTPIITSREIPSETEWYKIDTAVFKWNLPSDIISVQTSIDGNPDGIPTKTFTPAIASRTAILLDDGSNYFHVRFKNAAGWSKVASYKINIDNLPPRDFQATSELTNEGLTRLTLKATDLTSGMSQYVIYIDGTETATIEAENDVIKTKVLPVLPAGKHIASIRAYDKAKNFVEKTINFTAPELKKPILISYPSEVSTGERISIVGKAYYPNTDVKIYLTEDDLELAVYDVKTDTDGLFKFESRAVTANKFISIYAETNLSDKETKLSSDKVFVKMSKSIISIWAAKLVDITSAIVPLIGLLLLLAFFFYIFYMRFKIKQAKLRSDLHDAEMELHTEFTAIQANIDTYVKTLKKTGTKRDLTKEETKMLKEFSKVLTRIEKVVQLKIKNIEEKDL